MFVIFRNLSLVKEAEKLHLRVVNLLKKVEAADKTIEGFRGEVDSKEAAISYRDKMISSLERDVELLRESDLKSAQQVVQQWQEFRDLREEDMMRFARALLRDREEVATFYG